MLMLIKMNLFFSLINNVISVSFSVMNPVIAVVCLGILLIVAESGKLILYGGYMMFFSKVGSVRI